MFNKVVILTGLMTAISLSQCPIAHADDVNDAIREANFTADVALRYNRNVVVPEIQRQERYNNQLQNACYQGNTQACRKSTERLRRQNARFNRAILRQRQQLGYY
jgi:hypothetical protein